NPQSWVSTFASLHVDACTPNCTIQEWIQGPPWQAELFETEFAVQDGYAFPPDRPGLGLGFNEEEAAKHPYVPDFRPEWHWEEGMLPDGGAEASERQSQNRHGRHRTSARRHNREGAAPARRHPLWRMRHPPYFLQRPLTRARGRDKILID